MRSFLSLYWKLPWDRRTLAAAALLALAPVALSWLQGPKEPSAPDQSPGVDVATHIPRGFVLIPIDVLNYEALDSVLGPFGFVDLYLGASAARSGSKLVARNVRLLRAPNNPSHFAVLIPEREAPRILAEGGAFVVTVKRPSGSGTEFVTEKTAIKRSITYTGE